MVAGAVESVGEASGGAIDATAGYFEVVLELFAWLGD